MHAEVDANKVHEAEYGCLGYPERATQHRVGLLNGEAMVDGRLERPLNEVHTESVAYEAGGVVAHYHPLSESLVSERAQALGRRVRDLR